jgi:hypothetical protein
MPAHPHCLTVDDGADDEPFGESRIASFPEYSGFDFDEFDSAGCLDAIRSDQPKFAVGCGDSKMGEPRAKRTVMTYI